MANAGQLGQYLAQQAPPTTPSGPVELLTGTVSAWSAGNRTVSVLGAVQTVKYAADVVGSIAPGDTVAVLRVGGDHLLLCKVADA
jgi:hypothetical protein